MEEEVDGEGGGIEGEEEKDGAGQQPSPPPTHLSTRNETGRESRD